MNRDKSLLPVILAIIGFIAILIILFIIILVYDPYKEPDLGGYKIDSFSGEEYFISLSKGDTLLKNNLGFVHPGKIIKNITYYDSVSYGFAFEEGIFISPFIYPNEIKYDSTFILLVQYPIGDRGFAYTYPKSLYKDTTKVKWKQIPIWFFVINKVEDIEYGPYTLTQYLEKRKEIGIPDNLKLRLEDPDTLYKFQYKKLKYAR